VNQQQRLRVVVILGPTAAGKTEVSIALARDFDGEIISFDSRLFYRGMDIGTAKPTDEQRRQVPHHLLDVAEPWETWSVAIFRAAALKAIDEIRSRGRLPFLVGGTGQYLAALLKGWVPPPQPASQELRRELEAFAAAHGAQALHARLAAVDVQRAAQLDYRNVRRVVRALEIYHTTGTPPSRLRKAHGSSFCSLRIGLILPRRDLYARIDARIDAMLRDGLVEEVRGLLARGVPPDASAMSAIGYRQIVEYLQGRLALDEAVQRMRRATRQFARRQANWFRQDDPSIHWFTSRPAVEEQIKPLIRAWLSSSAHSAH
jgi:tRNA dimethylallyltransferase